MTFQQQKENIDLLNEVAKAWLCCTNFPRFLARADPGFYLVLEWLNVSALKLLRTHIRSNQMQTWPHV